MVWDRDLRMWEFAYRGVRYSLGDNPVFNPEVILRLSDVEDWIERVGPSVDDEIAKHLDGWCEWNGDKHLVSVDVSRLLSADTIDVAYAHDDWGDLGVNAVIANGRIVESYSGD